MTMYKLVLSLKWNLRLTTKGNLIEYKILFSFSVCSTCFNLRIFNLSKIFMAQNSFVDLCCTSITRPKEPVPSVFIRSKSSNFPPPCTEIQNQIWLYNVNEMFLCTLTISGYVPSTTNYIQRHYRSCFSPSLFKFILCLIQPLFYKFRRIFYFSCTVSHDSFNAPLSSMYVRVGQDFHIREFSSLWF